MIPADDRLHALLKDFPVWIAACSGGADSIAMTHLLSRCAKQQGVYLAVCHVNHQLRGESAVRDAQFVAQFCQKEALPYFETSVDVAALAKEKGVSTEEAGRIARYDFFARAAAELAQTHGGSAAICTAHTLSDQMETVLFHMVRGTGLAGLCGIPIRRGQIVRPMLETTREEIEAYCAQHALPYCVDETNSSLCYTRNRLRHQVVSALTEIHPKAFMHVGQMTESLREDEACLQEYAVQWEESARAEGGFRAEVLRQAPIAVQKRILFRQLKKHALPCSRETVLSAIQLLAQGQSKRQVQNEWYWTLCRGVLRLEKLSERTEENIPLKDGIYRSQTGKTYEIQTLSIIPSENFQKIYKKDFVISLDCGKICGNIILRHRLPGDRISLAEHRPHRLLKKIWNEQGAPLAWRTNAFVLSDDLGVIAVEGLGADQRVQCDAQTTCIRQICAVRE